MRLAILVGCVLGLILVSRWYYVPVEKPDEVTGANSVAKEQARDWVSSSLSPNVMKLQQNEMVTPVATAVYLQSSNQTQPVAKNQPFVAQQNAPTVRTQSFSNQTNQFNPARSQVVGTGQPVSNAVRSAPAKPGYFESTLKPSHNFASTNPSISMPANATNVRTLVRADYKLTIEAAEILEKLFLLDPEVPIETKIIKSDDEKIITLQITTSAETQRSTGNFLASLYPSAKLKKLKQQNPLSDDDSADFSSRFDTGSSDGYRSGFGD